MSRPITGVEFIDNKDPVEVMNYLYEMTEFGTPKLVKIAENVLEFGSKMQQQDVLKQITERACNLQAAVKIVKWFNMVSQDNIVMVHETDDKYIVTYNNKDLWFDGSQNICHTCDGWIINSHNWDDSERCECHDE